ncbi:MAG: DUF4168 domain-containing protein [Bacteroidales bacterium]
MTLKQIGIIMLAILFIYGCKNGENNQDDNDGETQKEMQPQNQQEQMDGPPQQNQPQAGDITDEELEKFASVFLTEQEVQQDMIEIIQDEGLSVQRFQQMQQASQNPEQELDASEEEMKQYESVMASIQEIQPESQKKIQDKIKEEGLTQKRYSEINNAMQQNQELQQRFQNIMQKEQPAQSAQPMPE